MKVPFDILDFSTAPRTSMATTSVCSTDRPARRRLGTADVAAGRRTRQAMAAGLDAPGIGLGERLSIVSHPRGVRT